MQPQTPHVASPMAAQQPPEMEVSKILLTLNKFFDIPRELTELDPLESTIDIVMPMRVRYYHKGSRLACISLPEEVISFSSSNILYKQDRFTVDFNSPNTVNLTGRDSVSNHVNNNIGGAGVSRGASVRSISQNNSTSSGAFQSALAATLSVGAVNVDGFVNESMGTNPFHHNNSNTATTLNTATWDANTPDDLRVVEGSEPAATPHRLTASRINNKILITYPTRADLTALVDVVFAVRERRKDSPSNMRWLTPIISFDALNPESRSNPDAFARSNAFQFQRLGSPLDTDSMHMCSFAEAEVFQHKILQRFIGIKAGHLSVTITVPHVRDDLRKAKYYHDQGEPFYFDPALIGGGASDSIRSQPYRHHDGPVCAEAGYYMHNKYETIAHMDLAEDVVRLNSNPLAIQRYRARLMQDAAQRLRKDCKRLAEQFDTQRTNPVVHAALAQTADLGRLLQQLEAGESEYGIYRSLLVACDPSYFTRRVARLCEDYPPTDAEMENIKSVSSNGLSVTSASLPVPTVSAIPTSAPAPAKLDSNQPYADTLEALLVEYRGNEEELIRLLSVEMASERRSLSPRTRYACYIKQYQLSDEKIRARTAEVFAGGHDVLDSDPDLYMQYLEETFHRKESQPGLCNYARVQYNRDERGFYSNTLRFPTEQDFMNRGGAAAASGNATNGNGGSGGGSSSNEVATSAKESMTKLLRLREERIPLQLTPFERPLASRDPNRPGEIDILLDKYAPEFQQIIPSIAAATREVITADEAVWREMRNSLQDRTEVVFGIFNERSGGGAHHRGFDEHAFRHFLARLSDHTYISPASLLAAVIYLDRLCLRHPAFCLTRSNVERLFVVMVRIASKVVDLRSVNNKNFANVFRLPTAEMNFYEERMLKLMDFDFFLSPEEFLSYTHLLDPTTSTLYTNVGASHYANRSHSTNNRLVSPPSRSPAVAVAVAVASVNAARGGAPDSRHAGRRAGGSAAAQCPDPAGESSHYTASAHSILDSSPARPGGGNSNNSTSNVHRSEDDSDNTMNNASGNRSMRARPAAQVIRSADV